MECTEAKRIPTQTLLQQDHLPDLIECIIRIVDVGRRQTIEVDAAADLRLRQIP